MSTRGDDGSWSRAYMAGSGLSLGSGRAVQSAELHLASGAELPRERVAALAQHRDPEVREAVARREDCPFGVLAALAHDSRARVRIAVASHARAGRTVLEHLARDRDSHVVKAVARNDGAPLDIVELLLGHRREEVRHVAQRVLVERTAAIHAGVPDATGAPFTRAEAAPLTLHAPRTSAAAPSSAPVRRVLPRTLAPRPSVGRRDEGPMRGLVGPEGPQPA